MAAIEKNGCKASSESGLVYGVVGSCHLVGHKSVLRLVRPVCVGLQGLLEFILYIKYCDVSFVIQGMSLNLGTGSDDAGLKAAHLVSVSCI